MQQGNFPVNGWKKAKRGGTGSKEDAGNALKYAARRADDGRAAKADGRGDEKDAGRDDEEYAAEAGKGIRGI